jgi:hypothetical protein
MVSQHIHKSLLDYGSIDEEKHGNRAPIYWTMRVLEMRALASNASAVEGPRGSQPCPSRHRAEKQKKNHIIAKTSFWSLMPCAAPELHNGELPEEKQMSWRRIAVS